MVRIIRAGELVQIWSKSNGKKALVASARVEGGAPRGLRLYDTGNGRTYTSNYQIGCSPARARVFEDGPDLIIAAFERAGLTPPPVVSLTRIGPVYRALHAAHRGTTMLELMVNGRRFSAP